MYSVTFQDNKFIYIFKKCIAISDAIPSAVFSLELENAVRVGPFFVGLISSSRFAKQCIFICGLL
jgi:hypothetical protein